MKDLTSNQYKLALIGITVFLFGCFLVYKGLTQNITEDMYELCEAYELDYEIKCQKGVSGSRVDARLPSNKTILFELFLLMIVETEAIEIIHKGELK